MDIKECLEERVKFCTKFPDPIQRRAVICIWDKGDQTADDFCGRLMEAECGKVTFLAVERNDMATELKNQLQNYREKIDKGELACPQGLYVLAVGTSEELCDSIDITVIQRYFSISTIEYCRIMEYGCEEETFPSVLTGIEWRVGICDTQAIAILLLKACYDPKLLGDEEDYSEAEGNILWLRAKEYSAIREGLARRLLKALNEQMKPSEYIDKAARNCLSPKGYWANMSSLCPKPEFLPILNYRYFEEQHTFINFLHGKDNLFPPLKERMRKNGPTVAETLKEMFGIEGDRLRTEWLREHMGKNALPGICREIIHRNRNSIQDKLKTHFSLYDICYNLPVKVLNYQKDSKSNMDKLEKRIEEILETRIDFQPLIEEVFKELKNYFDAWDQWISACFEYQWWEQMANCLQEIGLETGQEYAELLKAKNVLENLCIKNTRKPFSFIRDEIGDSISSYSALVDKMENSVNFDEFSREDLFNLIEDGDKFYTDSGDYHVDDTRRPHIYLLFHHSMEFYGGVENCNFNWNMLPNDFLPKSVLYELKIINMKRNKR